MIQSGISERLKKQKRTWTPFTLTWNVIIFVFTRRGVVPICFYMNYVKNLSWAVDNEYLIQIIALMVMLYGENSYSISIFQYLCCVCGKWIGFDFCFRKGVIIFFPWFDQPFERLFHKKKNSQRGSNTFLREHETP